MMDSMSNILRNTPFKKAIIRGVESAEIVDKGNEVLAAIFGAEIAEHANAAFVKDNILHIACLSSTVAQELKLQERRIISDLYTVLPGCPVTKLAFMV